MVLTVYDCVCAQHVHDCVCVQHVHDCVCVQHVHVHACMCVYIQNNSYQDLECNGNGTHYPFIYLQLYIPNKALVIKLAEILTVTL